MTEGFRVIRSNCSMYDAPEPFAMLDYFRFTCCLLDIEQGGVFLRKTPLGIQPSVKTGIENAVADYCMDFKKSSCQERDIVTKRPN